MISRAILPRSSRSLATDDAVIVGHAYGNWVARMTAADHPKLVRGRRHRGSRRQAIRARTDHGGHHRWKSFACSTRSVCGLAIAFFAPGNDPTVWLRRWHPEIRNSQRAAVAAVRQDEWWSGGTAPLLDLQAALDPFKPEAKRNEMKDEFGERVTVMVIPNASHSLIPEQPKAVVEALTTWIKGLPLAGGE